MTHVVGIICPLCDFRISSNDDARFCDECGRAVHDACRRTSPDVSPATCPGCGGVRRVRKTAPSLNVIRTTTERDKRPTTPGEGVIHACPHCGTDSFPHEEVVWVGPGRSVACKNCGGRVSTSVALAMVTLLLLIGPSFILGALALLWSHMPPYQRVGSRFAYFLFALALFMAPMSRRYYESRLKLVRR
jgi:hypothetical protein